jgi:hypothetical protein
MTNPTIQTDIAEILKDLTTEDDDVSIPHRNY